jgi:hypothetical protein
MERRKHTMDPNITTLIQDLEFWTWILAFAIGVCWVLIAGLGWRCLKRADEVKEGRHFDQKSAKELRWLFAATGAFLMVVLAWTANHVYGSLLAVLDYESTATATQPAGELSDAEIEAAVLDAVGGLFTMLIAGLGLLFAVFTGFVTLVATVSSAALIGSRHAITRLACVLAPKSRTSRLESALQANFVGS